MRGLSRQEHERRLADYANGLCDKALAAMWGMTTVGVALWRRKHGLSVHAEPRKPLEMADHRRTEYTELDKARARTALAKWLHKSQAVKGATTAQRVNGALAAAMYEISGKSQRGTSERRAG